jgi:hypothetical protein
MEALLKRTYLPFLVLILAMLACGSPAGLSPTPAPVDRLDTIPATSAKMSPADDPWPPQAGPGWSQPVPLEGPVNTAGAEDSPFIPVDGQSLYFFFTPDASIPAEKQVGDGVTGIWMSPWTGSGWGEPVRVRLTRGNEASLDGCEFVLGDEMWFCSARAGNINSIDWYIARRVNGIWSDWRNAGKPINGDYQVGELHISADGQQMVFGSERAGGFGGMDLWVSQRNGDTWGSPANLGASVNTSANEGWPYLTADGQELWFSRNWDIVRCLLQSDGTWGDCQAIITQLAGEPSLSPDKQTLYFVHHYMAADLSRIIEADIYVSHRLP